MHKVCFIYSFKPSVWVSCQKIVSNLVKAYKLNASELQIEEASFNVGMNDQDSYESISKVCKFKPDTIIFLDHKPHPIHFLNWLVREFKDENHNPDYIFHLYGDFTLHFRDWALTEELLKESKVLWYAASERQKNFLSEFIPTSDIEICPFPVDASEFKFDQGLRNKSRKSFNWPEDEFIFLFTGRLSTQKRIHQLIETFSKWRSKSNAKARMVFVGDTDKVGEPWLLSHEFEYEYFHKLQKILNSLPNRERVQIEMHGFKPNKELTSYYNAADCLVNISVHNDEDYGMSCAEAQACGLPLILTSWAGFTGFQRKDLIDEVRFVPVQLSKLGKIVDLETLESQFDYMLEHGKKMDRNKIQKVSLDWTSIDNASKIIKKNIKPQNVFKGFEPSMDEAVKLEVFQKNRTFTDLKKVTFNNFYMRVYRHYVGQS
jgi:glycosyltransferase involved in cell wall biosynthesis